MTDRKQRHRQKITIHDVARHANVSISTVSKALNKNGNLKEKTRDRVIASARELGFRPNDLAQALHRGKSFTVGLISNDSFGRFTMPIMEGLEACLAEERMAIFMCNATDDPDREAQHLDQLLGKRVDGLVFTARRSDRRPGTDLMTAGVPTIFVFAQSDDPGAVCLLPDDEGGARLATEHLIQLGRTRIAHITGPERFEAVQLRAKGYQSALKAAGLTPLPGYFRPGNWSESWGHDAVAALFDQAAAPPDAFFCGNDQIARGVADALLERDISVPGQVSIVGFDNWDVMVTAARPPLSSIDMNLQELGRRAGQKLLAMINGQEISGVERMPCTLVVRESCGGEPTEQTK